MTASGAASGRGSSSRIGGAPKRFMLAAALLCGGGALTACGFQIGGPSTSTIVSTTIARPSADFELGINIDFRALQRYSTAEVETQVTRLMSYAASLNSNAVTLSFPYAMPAPTANSVEMEPGTPSVDQLRAAIEAARLDHLRVSLRPYLDQTSLKKFGYQNWSGVIAPTNVAAWFSSLSALIAPYLRLAQQTGIRTFVVGSELNSLEKSPLWTTVLAKASTLFHGHLSYAANFDLYEADSIGVPVQFVGVDAYPPQKVTPQASIAQLTQGWGSWFDKVSAELRSRTTIYEIGIPATAGAYRSPYAWSLHGAYDPTIQANWFLAACIAARAAGIRGLYFWGLTSGQSFSATPGTSNRTIFYGRLGEQSIRSCFTSVYGPG